MRAVYQDLRENLFRAIDGKPIPWKKRLMFIAGIGLIAASFLVYLAYPIIFLLSSGSAIAKVVMAAGAWLLSWSSFTGGLLLAGLGRSRRLKSLLKRKNDAARPSTLQEEKGGRVSDDASTLN
ncbi:MAG TPA: hypothetical protein VIB79_23740 [Candidatus Binatia bacterium]|jgi:hypothetical protein